MKICCEWFERMQKKAGRKGMSILPIHDVNLKSRNFYLQSRALDHGKKLKKVEGLCSDGKMESLTLVMMTPLSYCPRCGENLGKIIEENLSEFDSLASDAKDLNQ